MRQFRSAMFAAVLILAPAVLRAQEIDAPIGSPPMLLLPVESSVVQEASVFLFQGSQGPVAAGLAYAHPLLGRLAVQGQGAFGHRELADDPTGVSEGTYAAGHVGVSFALQQDESSSLRVFAAAQADYRDAQRAKRFSIPAGLALAFTGHLGPLALSPLVTGGVALRYDDANTNRLFSGRAVGVDRTGWFAQLGLRVGVGSWWTQAEWGRDNQIDADWEGMPPRGQINGQGPQQVRAMSRFSVRVGFRPRG